MPTKNLYLFAVTICFVFVVNCFADDLLYEKSTLVIRFCPKTDGSQRSLEERNQVLSAISAGTVIHSVKLVPGLSLVKLPENVKVIDALPRFKGNVNVLYAEPNWKLHTASTYPNDPCFAVQWGLNNTGQKVDGITGTPDADIDAPEGWSPPSGIHDANSIIVGVIDSGVAYNHPDLKANMWKDPNGNHGHTFISYGSTAIDNNDPNDDYFHGTAMAGILGAVGGNGKGICGIAWHIQIMALKFLDSGGFGYSYNAVQCIDYAVGHGAKILNNSWYCLKTNIADPNGNTQLGYNHPH